LNANDAIDKAMTIFENLVCVTVFYWHYITLENPVRSLLRAFMYSGYVLTCYTFIYSGMDVIMDVLYSSGRLGISFDNVNAVGMMCSVTIIIACYFAIYEKISLSFILVIPTLLVMLASGSRKALIMLVLGIVLLNFFKAVAEKRLYSMIKFIFAIIVIMLILKATLSMTIFSGVYGRMEGLIASFTGEGKVDHSTYLRKWFIEVGFNIFKENPIIGVGMGNAHIINAGITGRNTYLHNNFVELLADGGLIGFTLYYSIYAYILYMIVRKHLWVEKEVQIIMAILLCRLVADYGMVSYYSKITYFYFMLFFIGIEKYGGSRVDELEVRKRALL
jgi:O-antigen ligase